MAYQGRQPGVGVRNRFIYSATNGQTSFSGADSNGLTLAYADATYVDVFLNGTLLVPVTDYAATTKTSVVLGSGAAASDIVEIVAYDISSIANAVPISGGTMTGNLTVQGTVAATAVTGDGSGLTGLPAGVGGANGVTFNDNVKAQFGTGNDLQIYHTGTESFIDEAGTGGLYIRANDRVEIHKYTGEVMIGAVADGEVSLYHNNAIKLVTTSTGVTVTQSGTDVGLLVTGGSYNFQAKFESTDAEANIIIEDSNSTNNANMIGVATNDMYFITNNSEQLRITSAGKVGIGDSSPSARLEIGGMAAGEQALLIQSGRNDALSNGLARINITDANCPFAGLQINHAGTGPALVAMGKIAVGDLKPCKVWNTIPSNDC